MKKKLGMKWINEVNHNLNDSVQKNKTQLVVKSC